jgi:hypothetical protein
LGANFHGRALNAAAACGTVQTIDATLA